MRKHLDEYDILTPVQHGFRKQHSFESHLVAAFQDDDDDRVSYFFIDTVMNSADRVVFHIQKASFMHVLICLYYVYLLPTVSSLLCRK